MQQNAIVLQPHPRRAIHRIFKIVLLDLARPQELWSETFDLVELARDGVERLEASGTLDGHDVSVHADTTTVMVTADPRC